MSPADTLLVLAGLWLVAVLTPGPNMILFMAVGLSSPTASIVAVAAAIVLGTFLWGLAGLFGLFWLFELFPAAAMAVKVAGGLYLAWMGFGLIRRNLAPAPQTAREPAAMLTPRRAFLTGLATALGNPKSLVFVSSLFAVTRLAEQPLAIGLAGVGVMIAMSTLYYVVLGVALRTLPFARRPGATGRVLAMGTGLVMMAYGGKMAWER
ncbi:MAG: LysE family translocator [Phreatobacter sp.]|nr:LysE family translocator [Phreatobacter sp.]